MGTDNLYHKNREKRKRDLERKQNSRSLKEAILIICEGEKTEVKYFKELFNSFSNVEIIHENSSPISIIKTAEEKKCEYDKLYCVFDRDRHTDLNRAFVYIKKQKKIKLIFSSPCFELWFWLYFKDKIPNFYIGGEKSPCKVLIDELKQIKVMKGYEKNLNKLHNELFDRNRIEVAISRAKNHENILKKDYCTNITSHNDYIEFIRKISQEMLSYTNVFLLIEELSQ